MALYFVYLQPNQSNLQNPYDLVPVLAFTRNSKIKKDLPESANPQYKSTKDVSYFTLSATTVFSFVNKHPNDIMPLTEWLEERNNFINLSGFSFFR